MKTVYLGTGPYAEMVCQLDEAEAIRRGLQRDADRVTWDVERRRLEAEDRSASEAFERVEALFRWVMEVAGFHRHCRGAWRKKRVSKSSQMNPDAKGIPKRAKADLTAVFARASTGDPEGLGDLRAVLDAKPAGYFDIAGSPEWLATDSAIREFAGENLVLVELMKRKLALMRKELAGENPSTLERLLADRVAYCWFMLYKYECLCDESQELPPRLLEAHQRRIDRAHRRYLSAIRSLALVRKLDVPTIRVNLAQVLAVQERAGSDRLDASGNLPIEGPMELAPKRRASSTHAVSNGRKDRT